MTNAISFQDQAFVPAGVDVALEDCDGEDVLRVIKPEGNMVPDVPTYARLAGSDFHDGGIADFEARADIEMDEWVHLKAEVSGAEGRFYVDDMGAPALVVPQMFGGAGARGGVGLYVDNGTDSLFRNLQVRCAD